MEPVLFVDRATGLIETERVYGAFFLRLLYASPSSFAWIARLCLYLSAHSSALSRLFGWWQKSGFTKKKIDPFVQTYRIDPSEFAKPLSEFSSFNDFFIRNIRPKARPIAQGEEVVILPADARYLAYPNCRNADGFAVKGKKFSLTELLQDRLLAERYSEGSMVIARLCPVDYHRFHFPLAGVPSSPRLIPGPLYSVNPVALKWRVAILAENRRLITEMESEGFGRVVIVAVGATHVGSIHTTYTPGKRVVKGEEMGYFSFGGSSLILLFEPGKIALAKDLLASSSCHLELRALMGQLLGRREA